MIVKDTEITLLNNRVVNKEKESGIWKDNYESAIIQRDSKAGQLDLQTVELKDANEKIKSLKKQNTGLKIGAVVLLGVIVYNAANKD